MFIFLSIYGWYRAVFWTYVEETYRQERFGRILGTEEEGQNEKRQVSGEK